MEWESALSSQWLCASFLTWQRYGALPPFPPSCRVCHPSPPAAESGEGWPGKAASPTPAPPSPPHISVSDLHDHQPDVPVLCFVQLMHQLPVIALWETWVRAGFKCVLPFQYTPPWVSPTTWGCLAALATASPRSEKYLWEIEGCGVEEGERRGLYPSQRQNV